MTVRELYGMVVRDTLGYWRSQWRRRVAAMKRRLRIFAVDVAWGFGMAVRRHPVARRELDAWRVRWREC